MSRASHNTCCEKGGRYEKQTCIIWRCNFQMGGLVYDNLQTMHELQDRVNYQQHGLSVNYINRVAIQQRLFVEFSCDLHIDSLLKSFTALCDYWTLYLVVATIVELNYLLETLCHVNSYSFLLLSISSSTEGHHILQSRRHIAGPQA